MDKVYKALDDIERKLTKIHAITAKGANKLTVKDVIKLARKGNSINSTIKKSIKEYSNIEPTEQEAQKVLTQMERIVDLEEKQMSFAIENKPTFDKLKVSGMVRKNLERSEENAVNLSAILLQKSPPSLKAQGEVLDKRAKTAFDRTMAMYKGASGGEEQLDDKVDDSD